MTDVTVKRIDEMDSLGEGRFVRCRAELGVSAFGFQLLDLPANDENSPEHWTLALLQAQQELGGVRRKNGGGGVWFHLRVD